MIKPHGGKLVDRRAKRRYAAEELRELPALHVSREIAQEAENIANGVFSPLQGFLGEEDLSSVLEHMRLASDIPWTMPILLDASEEEAAELGEGDTVALVHRGSPIALLELEERYTCDRKMIAEKLYGTRNPAHPGVAKTLTMKDVLLSGRIELLSQAPAEFSRYHLQPAETRVLFKEKGWRTVVGFQTRNPPHLGHEYVQKTALSFVDGIFINPVIGRKKKGDFRDEVILRAYDELLKLYYLRERAVLSILRTEMRYAGPREAVFHAIIRKNFGCTHFIVGRDHAGVGGYYKPYEAQEIFEEFPDLGITPVFFTSFFYCRRCGGVANEKTCPHEHERISYSGTEIRRMIAERRMPPSTCMRPEVAKVILGFENPFI